MSNSRRLGSIGRGLNVQRGKFLLAACWLAVGAVCVPERIVAAEIARPSAVGCALGSMFNPAIAPNIKTMGLTQRINFVDMVKEVRGNLELVIVVDATESMEEQLNGVRSMLGTMLGDLGRTLGDHVRFQIVMFRDFGNDSQAIIWPLGSQSHAFVTDMPAINKALEQLVPGSGRPYFYEPVDLALYNAITQIPWSTDSQDTHWILYIGDAPPLQVGFNEPENKASRSHSDQQLVTLANEKNIAVHAIVCPTREVDQKIYQSVVGELLAFCSTLTTQTGGLMLDMSDPDVLSAIQSAAGNAIIAYTPIDPITQVELDNYKSNVLNAAQAARKANRVAVLPHLPIQQMDFSRRSPAVLVADEMRDQLDGQGFDTVYMHQLEKAFFKYANKAKSMEELLQQVAIAVNANCVMWGEYTVSNPNSLKTGIFDVATMKYTPAPLVRAKDATHARLCSAALEAVSRESKAKNQPATFAAFAPERYKTRLVSSTPEIERLMGSARLALEQATELMATDPLASQLYESAEKDLLAALKLESNNPVINSMLAIAYFGKFQISQQTNRDERNPQLRSAIRIATEAYRYRNQASSSDAMEIEGDFRFYQGRFADAIAAYEKLAGSENNEQARRAHWMLAAMYSGDWGIQQLAPSLVDPGKARSHLIAILALWPDSHEASLLKRNLAWSDNEGKTLSPHVPVDKVAVPLDSTVQK